MPKRLKIVLLVLIGSLVGLFGLLAGVAWVQNSRLQEEMELARKAGMPLSREEWLAQIKASGAAQVALEYEAIHIEASDHLGFQGLALWDDDTREAKRLLALNARALELGEAASSREQCRFAKEWPAGAGISDEPYSDMERLANLFLLRAWLRYSSDPDGAHLDIRRAIRVGRHLSQSMQRVGTDHAVLVELMIPKVVGSLCATHPKDTSLQDDMRFFLCEMWDSEARLIGYRAALALELADMADRKKARGVLGLNSRYRPSFEDIVQQIRQPKTVGKAMIVKGYRMQLEALRLPESQRRKAMNEGCDMVVKGLSSFPDMGDMLQRYEALHRKEYENRRQGFAALVAVCETLLDSLKGAGPTKYVLPAGSPVKSYRCDGRAIRIQNGGLEYVFPL